MKPTELMRKYINLKLFTYSFNLMGTHFYNVEWSYKFEGGKKERQKFINHLNKLGFVYYNSYYTHKVFFQIEEMCDVARQS